MSNLAIIADHSVNIHFRAGLIESLPPCDSCGSKDGSLAKRFPIRPWRDTCDRLFCGHCNASAGHLATLEVESDLEWAMRRAGRIL